MKTIHMSRLITGVNNDRKSILRSVVGKSAICLSVLKWRSISDFVYNARTIPVFTDGNSRSRSLYAVARPSVCLTVCLSSVTLVRPTQAVEIFGNISTAFDILAIRLTSRKNFTEIVTG